MTRQSFQLVATPAAPRLARSLLAASVPQLGSRLRDAQLLASELMTRAVGEASSSVGFTIDVEDRVLRVEAERTGLGKEPEAGVGEDLGIKLMAALADSWGRDSGAGVEWFELEL